ncbi:MAG TPA: CHAT domain-containing tetratricopeptide repeat protein [Gemmatimonadales bacterium]
MRRIRASVFVALLLVFPGSAAAQAGSARAATLAREAPDSLREHFRRALAASAAARDGAARAAHIGTARELAQGYAAAWNDSLLLRQLARFERWPPRDRVTKAAADSLRRRGFEILQTEGPEAAMRLWARSRRLAESIRDSAGLAASLGNLGAGYTALGELDSAATALARSRTLAERVRDWRVLGNTLGLLGSLANARDDLDGAHAAFTSALAIRGRSGDDRGAAADENNLGLIAQALGDTAGARRAFEAALARNRRAGRSGPAAVNLANLAALATADGRFTRAAVLFREALALHRAAGETAAAGLDLQSIGNLALRMGDYPAAISALTEAAAILARTGPPEAAAAAHADLAQAHAGAGDLGAAARAVASAERGARDAGPAALAVLALARGDLAMDANAFADAESEYARAEALYSEAEDDAGASAARQGRGALQLRRGDAVGAARTFAAASAALRAAGDPRAAALTDLLLGAAQSEMGDPAAALATTRRAQLALRALGDPVAEASAFASLGDIAERDGAPGRAEAAYRRGLVVLGERAAPGVAASLRWGLGRSLRARGDLPGATRELQAAIAAVERVAGRLPLGTTRWLLLGDVADLHAELALVEQARGRTAFAFEASERMRGRQMRELLARGTVAPPPGLDRALALRERELRRHIGELEQGPLIAAAGGSLRDFAGSAAEPPSDGALAAARSEHSLTLESLGATTSAYASLVTLPRVDHRDVAARLRADEALIEYLVTDSLTLIFVVTRDSTAAVRVPVSRRELAAAVDFSRAAIETAPSGESREPWRPPLRRLHRLLITPAEGTGLLRNVRSLLVAPHAELHYLPFAALLSGTRDTYLVERYDIAYVPSAAIWMELGARPRAPAGGRVLAIAPFPGSLPGSRDEVRAIGRLYGKAAQVVVGNGATESAFRSAAPGYSVIHLATYGILNRHNPLFSYVALAPEAGERGRLEVHEVFGQPLRARLLVLSACETGLASGAAADVPAGDDWLGLVRAFLFAGADNVMATLWPIEDRPTSRIVPQFYRALEGRSPAAALAIAQREAIRDPRTSAPRRWAAFAIAGAGAR